MEPTPVKIKDQDEPIPVQVVGKDGLPVEKIVEKRKEPRQSQELDPSLPARTTFQQDLTAASQRNVNLIWETTQGKVAMLVILGTMVTFGLVVLISLVLGRDITTSQALLLGSIMSLATGVTSFYFSRTNHVNTGGVGPKEFEVTQAHR